MPPFSTRRLKSYMHPYPELQSKAHNVSRLYVQIVNGLGPGGDCSIAWLAPALAEYSQDVPAGDEVFAKMLGCVPLGLGLSVV